MQMHFAEPPIWATSIPLPGRSSIWGEDWGSQFHLLLNDRARYSIRSRVWCTEYDLPSIPSTKVGYDFGMGCRPYRSLKRNSWIGIESGGSNGNFGKDAGGWKTMLAVEGGLVKLCLSNLSCSGRIDERLSTPPHEGAGNGRLKASSPPSQVYHGHGITSWTSSAGFSLSVRMARAIPVHRVSWHYRLPRRVSPSLTTIELWRDRPYTKPYRGLGIHTPVLL